MPTAQPDIVQTTPGTPVTIAVLANDNGVGLTIVSLDSPTFGNVTLNSDRTITYTPSPGFQGQDSFGYTIRDLANATSTGMVTVSVRPPNHAPVAVDDEAATSNGGPVTIPVLANDNDPDGDPLALVAIETPAKGSLAVTPDQKLRYTPRAGQTGRDSFTYAIGDGRGGFATAAVRVTLQQANQPPVANDGTVTTPLGTPVVVNLLSQVSDPDQDQLTLINVSLPLFGRLQIETVQRVIYTPNSGFFGEDSFGYTISDGRGGTATGRVVVKVLRGNTAPVAANDNAVTDANTPVTIAILANDSDPDGDTLLLAALGMPSFGTVTINPDKTVTYLPRVGYVGPDEFAYTVSDGHGGSASATVTITVQVPGTPTSYLNGYGYRRLIGIPLGAVPGGTTHTGFPLLVQESGTWLRTVAAGGRVQSVLGHDIRFELEDGTKLDHDIDRYDGVAGELTAWVRLPSLSPAVGSRLHLYYGKAGLAAAEANPAGVWRNHLAVYHLPSGHDQTGRGRDLVATNVGTGSLIGRAGSFDGNAVLKRSDASWLDGLAAYSCSMWIQSSQASTDAGLLAIGTITGADEGVSLGLRYDAVGYSGGATRVITMEQALTGGRGRLESAANLSGTARQHIALTWTQSQQPRLFVDGVERATSFLTPIRNGVTSFTGPLHIGAGPRDGANGGWQGLIDEVRFQAGILAPDWIATEYASQSDPQAFYGIGGEDAFADANKAPLAQPVRTATDKGVAVDIDVLARAYDPDPGASLTIAEVGTPASGTATIVAGKIRYTPTGGFAGSDGFTFRISDGSKSSVAKVVVEVRQVTTPETPDNDKPYSNRFYGCLMHCDTIGNTRFTKGRPVSVRFRAERSGQIASFLWNLRYNAISSQGSNETSYSTGNGGRVMVELRKNDPAGGPARWWPDMSSGGLLGKTQDNNGEPGQLVGRPEYPVWNLISPVSVTAGTLYHLVFHQLDANQAISVNLHSSLNPVGFGSGNRAGPYYGDDYAHLWALSNWETEGWFSRPHHLAFLELNYADGQICGVGEWFASATTQKPVGGANMARERFTVEDYTRTVGGVWCRVRYESGTPSDLVLRLENSSGGLIEQVSIGRGDIARSDLSSAPVPWVYRPFATPRTLAKGSGYRIRFSASSGEYFLGGTVDGGSKGYRSRNRWTGALAEYSTNSGTSWRGWTVDKWNPSDYRTDMHLPVGFTVVG